MHRSGSNTAPNQVIVQGVPLNPTTIDIDYAQRHIAYRALDAITLITTSNIPNTPKSPYRLPYLSVAFLTQFYLIPRIPVV
jgi:hypothetical protein